MAHRGGAPGNHQACTQARRIQTSDPRQAEEASASSRSSPGGETVGPVRFWDSSAIVPLVLEEAGSAEVLRLLQEDSDLIVWCLAEVEVSSALARRQREGGLEDQAAETSFAELRKLQEQWDEIVAVERVRSRAVRILRVHPLVAADALQLAASLVASEERPEGFPFVCLDARLRDAAQKEGFQILP